MSKLYDYLVSFDTYQNRVAKRIEIAVVASNAKNARAIAEDLWYTDHTPHMFHINVRRKPADPCDIPHKFRVKHWETY